MTVTKDTLIGDILDMDTDTAPYFLAMGMHRAVAVFLSRSETADGI